MSLIQRTIIYISMQGKGLILHTTRECRYHLLRFTEEQVQHHAYEDTCTLV